MNNKIKHRIIDKVLVSDDEKLLHAIDQIMESASTKQLKTTLTNEQKKMLDMSEQDIKNGETISQSKLDEDDLAWLSGK